MVARRAKSSSCRDGWSMWCADIRAFPARQSTRLGRGLRRDDGRAFRSAVARLAAGLVLAGALASCWFHLRGGAHYAFETLYLNSPASQPLTTDLRRSLEGAGSAKLVPAADQAQVILDG